ncbi:MAG: beta-N-acetylhexosaminidase [Ignavibacteriaceae bacterium]|nr:beta-N-acetylhexosaminidase [Ignavibacteriaceae bacterium]
MKLYFKEILFSLMLASGSNFGQGLNIVPEPVSATLTNDKFVLQNGSDIFLLSDNKDLRKVAEQLKNIIHKRTGFDLNIKNGNSDKGIVIGLSEGSSVKPEGYVLTVNNNLVKISGKDCAGVFYGIESFQEILKRDSIQCYLPGCEVSDYPRYGHRGFMLDASRHFQSVDFVKKVLDVMALLKLNVFHWHLTDDQGWRIESRKYPRLNEIGSYRDSINSVERNGYYTVEEIHDVIQYAKNLHIKIIPEVEMPGHSQAVMDSYPELLCPTNKGGNTYCAGNIKSYEFIKNVLDEVVSIFNTDIIVVGGDERPKGIWEKDSLCKAMIAKQNLANEDLLQNYFMKNICDYISGKGVKTIAWAENLKGGVPENQYVENYYPDVSMESARGGYYTINSNCFYTYFDYPNTSEEKKVKPDWMPVLDLARVYSFNPTPDSLEDASKKFIIGTECALWTEVVMQHDIQFQLFPRILAFSEDAWSPNEKKNYDNFVKRVKEVKPVINSMGFEFDKGGW